MPLRVREETTRIRHRRTCVHSWINRVVVWMEKYQVNVNTAKIHASSGWRTASIFLRTSGWKICIGKFFYTICLLTRYVRTRTSNIDSIRVECSWCFAENIYWLRYTNVPRVLCFFLKITAAHAYKCWLRSREFEEGYLYSWINYNLLVRSIIPLDPR